MKKLINEDYPGLFQIADHNSILKQKNYFSVIAANIILLLLAAIIAYLNNWCNTVEIKVLTAFLFIGSLALTIWIKFKRYNEIWYNSRAVAESVKTRTWRFIMRATPYEENDEEKMRKRFILDLKMILRQNEEMLKDTSIKDSIEDPISNRMEVIRAMDLNERFEYYKMARVEDQAKWYSKNAKANRIKGRNWFIASICLHVIVIVLLMINIANIKLVLPIEIIAVLASSFIAWIEARKYNELQSSYTLAANEIVLMKEEKTSIKDSRELSEYVLDCEFAFSREHTQWVARRKNS